MSASGARTLLQLFSWQFPFGWVSVVSPVSRVLCVCVFRITPGVEGGQGKANQDGPLCGATARSR
eukprot:5448548-Amphidinium_carterae.1